MAFRGRHAVLAKGSLAILRADDEALALVREWDGRRIVCAFNLTGEDLAIALPQGLWHQDMTAPFAGALRDRVAELPPYQGLFALELD